MPADKVPFWKCLCICIQDSDIPLLHFQIEFYRPDRKLNHQKFQQYIPPADSARLQFLKFLKQK